MKKLTIAIATAAIGMTLFAETPEEMLARKDYAGVETYCKTNKNNDTLIKYVRASNVNDWIDFAFKNNDGYAMFHGIRAYAATNNLQDAVRSTCEDSLINKFPQATLAYDAYIDVKIAKDAYQKFLKADAKHNLIRCTLALDQFSKEEFKLAIENSAYKSTTFNRLLAASSVFGIDFILSIYTYDKIDGEYAFNSMMFKRKMRTENWTENSVAKIPSIAFCIAVMKDIVRNSNVDRNTYVAAKLVDQVTPANAGEFKRIAMARVESPAYRCMLAVDLNDIDAIIDSLLVADDSMTPAQVAAVIKPLNSVEADYRKADILKALNNINSRYTIKLFDDQAAWEPIISKIRAMIDVRK